MDVSCPHEVCEYAEQKCQPEVREDTEPADRDHDETDSRFTSGHNCDADESNPDGPNTRGGQREVNSGLEED